MELSRVERILLTNQMRILAALYPDEAAGFEKAREALANGFEITYDWFFEDVYDDKDTLSRAGCREVLDILGMFQALEYAYKQLSDTTGLAKEDIEFQGFDGNEETRQFAFTHYLWNEGKFTNISRGTDDGNSHCPMLYQYRAMVDRWKNLPDKYKPTKEDMIKVVG